MTIGRRDFLIGGAAASAALLSGLDPRLAFAQAPSALEVLIGFAPGGGTDRSARVIAPLWAAEMGISSPVAYTYAPGAGGIIAVQQLLARGGEPGLVNLTALQYTAWNIALKEGGYTLDDIAFIGSYFDDPDVLLVARDSEYDTIDQFIAAARETEKTVSVSAPMSPSHAATVVLREITGAKLKVVPFNGGSESRNAVAGGHVDACLAPYWSALHVLELTKAIGIFADENPAPEMWQPVPANQVLDVEVPDLIEPYVIMTSAATAEANPEAYQSMVDAFETAVTSEAARETARENQRLDLFLKHRRPEGCIQYLEDYLALLEKYRPAMQADLDRM